MWSSIYWQDSRQNLGKLPRMELDSYRSPQKTLQELVANTIENEDAQIDEERDIENSAAHGK